MKGPVLIFTESSGSQFRKSSYEALTEGRRLADLLGTQEYALSIGKGLEPAAGELGRYGADHVLLSESPDLELFHPEYYREIVLDAVRKVLPSILLLSATSAGKDLAPRLATHLNTGLASECVQLELQGAELVATRPAYAGKVLVRLKIKGIPQIATLRPNVFTAKQLSAAKPTHLDRLPYKKPDS